MTRTIWNNNSAGVINSVQEEQGHDDESDSDDEDDVDDDKAGRKRLLSIASNATSVSSHPDIQVVWETEIKRPRTLSIENGSW